MEAVRTKNVAVVMMLLLAVVQDVYSAPSLPPSPALSPNSKKFWCKFKCDFKCALKIGDPLGFAQCIAICHDKCKSSPSNAAVYSCTESCARSKITSLKPADSREVKGYVASCYEDCSNKH
ncbi:hypothetical protein CJ030_MR6G019630 [Morella rubra]|uniref:Thionin-like protein 2 n=1 Tax=Morella rubra TaxID=262757 RepID=A0A6A1VDN6_9ROSI|nr:hypothetical protein CJ030_MR6G019630 [Morella rubra]